MRIRASTKSLLLSALALLACAPAATARAPASSANGAERSRQVTQISPGSYKALIIGIGEYRNYDKLAAADKDAEALASLLKIEYGYESPVVLVNADDAAIRHAFEELKDRIEERDRLLIYFSGHGSSGADAASAPSLRETAGYWLPVNAEVVADEAWKAGVDKAASDAHWISREYVVNQVKELRAAHILVVDDSCYSGRIEQLERASPSEASLPQPEPVAVTTTPGANSTTPADTGAESTGAYRRRRVRMWLTAGSDEPVAARAGHNPASVFTGYFLDVLRRNDGAMNGTQAFLQIREHMLASREQQTPDYVPLARAEHGGGDFLFIKKTYSVEQRELGLGMVTVRVTNLEDEKERTKAEKIASLVLNQLIDVDRDGPVIRPDGKPRPLYLAVSLHGTNELALTLIDRQDDQIMATTRQKLSNGYERLTADVRAAVLNLHDRATRELYGKEISVDIVKRALVAQRIQSWDAYGLVGVAAYVDFDGEGLLHKPAWSFRLGAEHNFEPWFLLGFVAGLDTTSSETSRSAFLGDLADGTYSNNRFVGQVAFQTITGMLRATARAPHGIVLPFGYASVGVARLIADLSDEYFEPVSSSDTLPLNIINRRKPISAWGFAWEIGGGAHLVFSEHFSLLVQANFFKVHHDMKIVSQIEGLNQVKPVTSPFQAIQTISAEAGPAILF